MVSEGAMLCQLRHFALMQAQFGHGDTFGRLWVAEKVQHSVS